jgi:hypothetical protein
MMNIQVSPKTLTGSEAMAAGKVEALLSGHYLAVKRRLGVPIKSKAVNNKDELIAHGRALKEEEKKRRAAEREEHKRFLQEHGFHAHNSRNAPRPNWSDDAVRLKNLPFDETFTPELAEPTDMILRYFGVTWEEVVGPSRIKVIASARAAVICLLLELGASPYALAKLIGRDESTIRTIDRTNGAAVRKTSCVSEATSCARNNGLGSLRRWKLPPSKTQKRKER